MKALPPKSLSPKPLTRRALLTLLSVGIPLLASLGAAPAESTVTVNPSADWGTWQGWGCSLAWWANVFGTRDDIADIVFTTKSVVLNGGLLPGLGLTIARYNAGGCSPKAVGGITMQASSRIPAFKQIQGFWQDSSSPDPASSSWDWTVDANQRLMLQKARDRGASHFELFSNSPLWWMCRNHNPSGADNGADDNLPPENLRRHAVYLAAIAKYAADHWGIQFDSVEAFNEPSANWWNSHGTQEGCHFDAATQAVVIAALREELDTRGLSKIKVAASDENTYDEALHTWNSFRPAIKAQVSRVNVHGYQEGGGRRDLLFQATQPAELWNSEYGEGDGSGMSLAANLALDLRDLHPTAWCYWQPLDGSGWGLIQSDLGHNHIGAVNPKYFVLAHYSRHIRPGMTILDGGDDSTVAAYDPAAHKLVLVTANHQAGQWATYDLSRFRSVSGPVTLWTTDTGAGGERYAIRHDVRLNGKQFRAWLGPNTVQTFEVQAIK
jgi:galactan endo-1,6-beta-galactosidase